MSRRQASASVRERRSTQFSSTSPQVGWPSSSSPQTCSNCSVSATASSCSQKGGSWPSFQTGPSAKNSSCERSCQGAKRRWCWSHRAFSTHRLRSTVGVVRVSFPTGEEIVRAKIPLSRTMIVAGVVALAGIAFAATSLAVAHPIVTFKRLPNGLIQYKLPKFYGPCKRQYKVYEFQAHRADAWAQSTAKETNSFGKSHCLKVTNQDAGGYQNVNKQLSQLDAAIARKPDAIILWSTDSTAVVGEVKKARKAGIKVINFTVPANTHADAYVSGDWHIDGGLMANA